MRPLAKTLDCPASVEIPPGLCRKLVAALRDAKTRILEKYERALPGRTQVLRELIAEAEALAWETPFPHLFLPDFAEARLAELLALPRPPFAREA